MSEPALIALTEVAEASCGRVRPVSSAAFAALVAREPAWTPLAGFQDFAGQAGRLVARIDETGRPEALFGLGAAESLTPLSGRTLAGRLPPGDWMLAPESLALFDEGQLARFAGAFVMGLYGFDRFRSEKARPGPRLAVPIGVHAEAHRLAQAAKLARDLVNRPANDLGPAELEAEARLVAERFGARASVVAGEALLEQGYPAIHAVGRAAAPARSPRLIEIDWAGADARPDAPRLVIIGKGVTFDTGGLDLKPSPSMRLMKKDMGGAAHALALAQMVMARDLPVRLTLLIPAVENAVSGDAMRPGDVLATRKGLSVEIGNTDAEGRLILADALTRAAELSPDLTVDLATLTGAARIALGPEVIPFYTDDEDLAREMDLAARETEDPLWRMPLVNAYDEALESDIADLKNDSDAWAQAGSITAALFLRRFAPKGAWVHLDLFAWNPRKLPGRPAGAEVQAIRALDHLLARRFGAAQT